jgi:DNA-binding beta-propeller fold protein YncE
MQVRVKNLKHASAAVTFSLLVAGHAALAQGQTSGNQVLKQVADVPLPGPAVRFDYQSLDVEHNRLYIAHMNADQLVLFDIEKRQVVANLDGFKRVHGVTAVPEINRVYASVTGEHQVAAVDMNTLKTVATSGPVSYPDGLAYSPATKRVFVSDEHGGVDAVGDTASGKLLTNIPLGGGAGKYCLRFRFRTHLGGRARRE